MSYYTILYQVSTLAGVRGQVGDTLLDLKTPGLFVVGERSSQCNTDDIEVIKNLFLRNLFKKTMIKMSELLYWGLIVTMFGFGFIYDLFCYVFSSTLILGPDSHKIVKP